MRVAPEEKPEIPCLHLKPHLLSFPRAGENYFSHIIPELWINVLSMLNPILLILVVIPITFFEKLVMTS